MNYLQKMKDFIKDFKNRVEEIEKYFDFVSKIDSIEPYKCQEIILPDNDKHIIDSNLQKILRANCYLMMYNLIESAIRNGIIAIYDAIHDENLTYKDICDNIQSIWITYRCENLIQPAITKKTVLETIRTVLEEVINEETIFFEKEKLPISGNLDRDEIQRLREQYKFYGRISNDNDRLKFILGKIKKIRNDLAHGNISFREAGRNVIMSTLIEFKDEVIKYLEDILSNIDEYIDNGKFRK